MSKDIYVHNTGKGSKQRPTDKQKYDEGWDRIFGKKEKEESRKPFHWVLGAEFKDENNK